MARQARKDEFGVTQDDVIGWMVQTGQGYRAAVSHFVPASATTAQRKRALNRYKGHQKKGIKSGRILTDGANRPEEPKQPVFIPPPPGFVPPPAAAPSPPAAPRRTPTQEPPAAAAPTPAPTTAPGAAPESDAKPALPVGRDVAGGRSLAEMSPVEFRRWRVDQLQADMEHARLMNHTGTVSSIIKQIVSARLDLEAAVAAEEAAGRFREEMTTAEISEKLGELAGRLDTTDLELFVSVYLQRTGAQLLAGDL